MTGFVPPRPGEEMWICTKCGKRFRPGSRGNLLSVLLGSISVAAPKCPKCGSRMVHRDFTVRY